MVMRFDSENKRKKSSQYPAKCSGAHLKSEGILVEEKVATEDANPLTVPFNSMYS